MRDFELNNNVIVEVKGTQTVGEMSDTMEVITPGTYSYRNGTCYVMYHEYNEESKQPIKNLLKIGDDKIELVKRGEYNVNMVFGSEGESLSYYNTPFGQILIGIITENVNIHSEIGDEKSAVINIKYKLTMNGEYASDNEINIVVRNGEGAS